jgi:hypothetical protein
MEVMSETSILTDKDFVDGRPTDASACKLVILHANLFGVTPAEGDDHSDARDLLKMALEVAQDFPEVRLGMLNCLEYAELAEKQSVYVSEFGTRCALTIFIEGRDPHVISAGYNETPETLHHWVQGILAAWGLRPTVTREEIVVRLAYDIAQPPEVNFPAPRWDDPETRAQAIRAAREALGPLYKVWVPGFDLEPE